MIDTLHFPAHTDDALRKARLRVALLVSLCWIAPALLAVLDAWLGAKLGEGNPPTLPQLLWRGGDWLLYALFTPFVFLLGRRYPLRRGHLASRLLLHFLAALFFCAAWAGAGILLRWFARPDLGYPELGFDVYRAPVPDVSPLPFDDQNVPLAEGRPSWTYASRVMLSSAAIVMLIRNRSSSARRWARF